MTAQTPVDRMYSDAKAIAQAILESEPSLATAATDTYRKALLLAAASYFEHVLCGIVEAFIRSRTNGCERSISIVRNKAIHRQYHTWFQWDAGNANQFFGMFGPTYKEGMAKQVAQDEHLRDSVASFLEVGGERNRLVHRDFASFALEKTIDEVYDLYRKALYFLSAVEASLAR